MGALRDFVADLLETQGAAVEPLEPDALEVLVPEPLQRAMGWPELARLGFGAELPHHATAVGLEGDWLDRFGALLGEHGRFARRQLPRPDPCPSPGDPEKWLGRALDLPNAVWRFHGSGETWSRCLILVFRYTALSDEKREGLVSLGFNCGTGAWLGDVAARLRLALEETGWAAPEPAVCREAGSAWSGAAFETRVTAMLRRQVRDELEPFLRAMRRRLDRDRRRVHDYHNDLRIASLKKLAGLAEVSSDKAENDRRRETARVAAIEREYRAKLDDLRHNYALRVTVEWVQGLELFVPVHRAEVLIRRRKGERLVAIDWHPTVRLAEMPPCDWGEGMERTRLVCDERLHLTDPAAQAACPSCAKAFCRACHPLACPRCGQAVEEVTEAPV